MKKIAVGIMSGTSLDGIDVAVVEISNYSLETKVKMLYGETIEFKKKIKEKIINATDLNKSNVQLITSLNYELADVFADAVIVVLKHANISLDKIDFVASHGQTIWHQPVETKEFVKSTLQIGEGAVLSERLRTTVISNFRAADIASGGQGAPLVAFVDELLFKVENKNISLHNLGGISNLTMINNKGLIAYDTGPANIMINYAMKKIYNKEYDESGKIAYLGKLIIPMYKEVMDNKYFSKVFPKTTGRELFGEQFVDYLMVKYQNELNEDFIHTITMVTVDSIVNEYKKLEEKYGRIDEIIFSGGGVYNNFIIHKIKEKMNSTLVSKIDKYGINSDFKEAIAFAILGNETLNFRYSNNVNATGAKKRAILGQINYYYKEDEEKR